MGRFQRDFGAMGFFSRIFRPRTAADPTRFPADDGTIRELSARADVNEAIARDGVAVFPWLSVEEVDALADVVRRASQDVDHQDVHIPTNFRLSAFNNDSAFKSRLYDAVHALLARQLEELLPGYVPLVINVFEKHPQSGYDPVPIHQNPSFVPEPEHKSVSLWIPLQDVSRENGTVGVLKGSHNRFNLMRAGNMPHEEVFELVERQLEERYFEPLDLRKGEAIALDDSIVHWSYPNVSDGVRTAVQLIMVPRAAPHIYYYYDDSGDRPMMDLYEVDKNFFFLFNCKARPEGLKKIGRVPYEYRKITGSELFADAR
jgi:hypothetical protein